VICIRAYQRCLSFIYEVLVKYIRYFVGKFINSCKQLYGDYLYFERTGTLLPKNCIVKGIKNIQIGKGFTIGTGCKLYAQDGQNNTEIIIEDRVSLNYDVSINADCGGKITIGKDTIIGPGTVIRASNHRFDNINVPIRDQGHVPGIIKIGNNVWLGAGVILLPNISIGNNTIIGAGSVVTKDIPENVIAVGVPAAVIKSR